MLASNQLAWNLYVIQMRFDCVICTTLLGRLCRRRTSGQLRHALIFGRLHAFALLCLPSGSFDRTFRGSAKVSDRSCPICRDSLLAEIHWRLSPPSLLPSPTGQATTDGRSSPPHRHYLSNSFLFGNVDPTQGAPAWYRAHKVHIAFHLYLLLPRTISGK